MKYYPYSQYELDKIINRVGEIANNPHMLFTAYAISNLCDLVVDEECDETANIAVIWGATVPIRIIDHMVKDIVLEFVSAIENDLQVMVFGQWRTIRNAERVNTKALSNIFNFSVENECYIIAQDGIMNLDNITILPYEERKNMRIDTLEYFRKIVYVVETDENDGWYKLTDMEAAFYCWGFYYAQHHDDNLQKFFTKYSKNLNLELDEIKKGCGEQKEMGFRTKGLLTFTANAIRKWNKANQVSSIIDQQDSDKADEYWYGCALLRKPWSNL